MENKVLARIAYDFILLITVENLPSTNKKNVLICLETSINSDTCDIHSTRSLRTSFHLP